MSGRAEAPAASMSVVDLEILRTSLVAYVEELATVLANAAPIAEISQTRAFSVAIADVHGGIVAIDNPLDLGSVAQAVGSLLDYFEFDLKDGDVVVTNDPYAGGNNVHELTLLAPLSVDGEMLLHVVVRVPVRDLGGYVSGGLFPTATELTAEGVPVTPIKIQRLGRPVRDILGTLLLNSRRGEETALVLDAARAVLSLGRQRLAELASARGSAAVRAGLEQAQAYSEQRGRAAFASWNAAPAEGSGTLPNEPSGSGPVTVLVRVSVDDGGLVLDFSDSDDQRGSFVNCSEGTTASCALRAVLAQVGGGIPANSGLLRAIRIVTRPGTVTHASAPAAVGWGSVHCGSEVTDAVARALRSVAAHPLPGLTAPRPMLMTRRADERRDHVDLAHWAIGGASATAELDGWGVPALSTRAALPSVEEWEPERGMQVDRLELIPDSAGAGQRVGAPGLEVEIMTFADRIYTLWSQHLVSGVEGFSGGAAGQPGELAFIADGAWQEAPGVAAEEAVDARRIRMRLSGGGGYGDPRLRDQADVRADLEDGLISAATARDVYGLDVDESTGADHD